MLELAQQGLPLLVERRVLHVRLVHEDLEADAIPPEPDPALLGLVVVHACKKSAQSQYSVPDIVLGCLFRCRTISNDVWYIVEEAYC